MLDFALGEVGLLPEQFWGLTWAEYERAAAGYQRRQAREWERTRELLVQQHNLHAKKPLTAHKYLPLPTDEPAKEAANPAELRAFRDRMKAELSRKTP